MISTTIIALTLVEYFIVIDTLLLQNNEAEIYLQNSMASE